MRRGQALVELAVCAPVIALLGLGTAAVVQVAEADAGLAAATQAAVAAAARAPDASLARAAAQERFDSVLAGYPVREAALSLDVGAFGWGGAVAGSASGYLDVGWAPLLFADPHLPVHARATARIESWRTHR